MIEYGETIEWNHFVKICISKKNYIIPEWLFAQQNVNIMVVLAKLK